jgi:glycosyltransferase involved in cell wall biosynthesis
MIPVSVIVTTYESPAWLEKVLWGYSVQTHKNFEVIVADDGSSELTAGLLEELQRMTNLSIRHVWHEKRGFRKCRILNKAILAAEHPYLLFSDGDCIPRNDFVAVHARYARPGAFLSGGIVRLDRTLSDAITRSDIFKGDIFEPWPLIRRGHRIERKLRMLVRRQPWVWLFEQISQTRPTFNGHHSSAWKEDILAVNGFDERMEYGGLDRELGERLVNRGIVGRSIRHRTVMLHLDHDRPYVTPDKIERNWLLRVRTRLDRRQWSDFGIRPPSFSEVSAPCADSLDS